MKKKIVIKVLMKCECDKCRKKALGIAASAHGVISVGITGDAKDRLEVVGDGVDSVCLVRCLRRKFCHAEIVQVEEVKENKPEKKPEKKTEETKVVECYCHHHQHHCYCHSGCYCHHHCHPPPIVVCEEQSNCLIM